MILAAALLAMGLLAPYVLRRAAGHMAPPLVVAAQLAGLVLAWLGVIDLVSVWAMPDHGLLGLCQAVLFAPHDLSELPGDVLLVTGGAALGGRGAYAMATTYRVVRRARQRIDSLGPQTVDGLTFVELGQVACTVGFVRSQILVDRARLAQLTPAQQRAVIAHERSHARRWHGRSTWSREGWPRAWRPRRARVSPMQRSAGTWRRRRTTARHVTRAVGTSRPRSSRPRRPRRRRSRWERQVGPRGGSTGCSRPAHGCCGMRPSRSRSSRSPASRSRSCRVTP